MAARFLSPLILSLGELKSSMTIYTAASNISGKNTRSLLSYRNDPLTLRVSIYWGVTEILWDVTDDEDPNSKVRCRSMLRNNADTVSSPRWESGRSTQRIW